LRQGFARVGIAPAVPPPRQEIFHAWLDRGFAGAMRDWLERHATLRADPARLLPGARSVIMLATDHAIGPLATSLPSAPGRGRVARYAWGDDYHDLLRNRVNALAAPGASSTRRRWRSGSLPGSPASDGSGRTRC
jgi:epoxyqueuosine reductase